MKNMGNNMATKALVVKIQRDPLIKRMVSNPFKAYAKIGSITFGITFVTNSVTSIFSEECRDMIKESPGMFSTLLLGKSAMYGIMWPSFYLGLLVKPKSRICLTEKSD